MEPIAMHAIAPGSFNAYAIHSGSRSRIEINGRRKTQTKFMVTLAAGALLFGCADREAARRDAIAQGIQHCASEGKMFVYGMAQDKIAGDPFSPVVVNGYCLTPEQFRAAQMVPDPDAAKLVRQNQMQQMPK